MANAVVVVVVAVAGDFLPKKLTERACGRTLSVIFACFPAVKILVFSSVSSFPRCTYFALCLSDGRSVDRSRPVRSTYPTATSKVSESIWLGRSAAYSFLLSILH